MKTMKKRIFAGAVCEQIVYNVSDRAAEPKKAEPRPRFKTEQERAEHRRGIARRACARKVNENFTTASMFSTLTCDAEHELVYWDDARRVMSNYVRRLQRACPDAKIMLFKGRGKNTHRIHFHMISDGIPAEIIAGKWADGNVIRCDNLREHNYFMGVDQGADFTALANYCFDHWTPDQGGHYYFSTRNIKEPEAEPATECVRSYSPERPPIAPKGFIYTYCSYNKYGYMRFHYVKEPQKKRHRKKEKDARCP